MNHHDQAKAVAKRACVELKRARKQLRTVKKRLATETGQPQHGAPAAARAARFALGSARHYLKLIGMRGAPLPIARARPSWFVRSARECVQRAANRLGYCLYPIAPERLAEAIMEDLEPGTAAEIHAALERPRATLAKVADDIGSLARNGHEFDARQALVEVEEALYNIDALRDALHTLAAMEPSARTGTDASRSTSPNDEDEDGYDRLKDEELLADAALDRDAFDPFDPGADTDLFESDPGDFHSAAQAEPEGPFGRPFAALETEEEPREEAGDERS